MSSFQVYRFGRLYRKSRKRARTCGTQDFLLPRFVIHHSPPLAQQSLLIYQPLTHPNPQDRLHPHVLLGVWKTRPIP